MRSRPSRLPRDRLRTSVNGNGPKRTKARQKIAKIISDFIVFHHSPSGAGGFSEAEGPPSG
jgi:hypothetical protein